MYREVVIETYRAGGEPSRHSVRARPVGGQGFDATMKVECSSSMRTGYPVGTKFKVRAKITDREGSRPFLYTSYRWPYEVLSDQEAHDFIRAHYGT